MPCDCNSIVLVTSPLWRTGPLNRCDWALG